MPDTETTPKVDSNSIAAKSKSNNSCESHNLNISNSTTIPIASSQNEIRLTSSRNVNQSSETLLEIKRYAQDIGLIYYGFLTKRNVFHDKEVPYVNSTCVLT